jgi:hypothetical protein
LDCTAPYDGVETTTSLVDVVEVSPSPLRFVQSPDPVVAGDEVALTGQGCVANGEPFQILNAQVFHQVGGGYNPAATSGEVMSLYQEAPMPNGEWQWTFQVPPGFSGGTAETDVICRSADGPIIWWRVDNSLTLRVIGVTKPAVVRDGLWYLRRSTTDGPADVGFPFTYGDPGDRPLFGDWDGEGSETAGVVRGNAWFLRNSNTDGPADISFTYGDPGDTSVRGDWNGDGVDTPGVVRNGVWYLRNSNSSGPADITFVYGDASDTPVVGDWNGDGLDTPGVARPGDDQAPNGGDKSCLDCAFRWLLRNSNTTGQAATEYECGDKQPVPADWTGDGHDSCGYRLGNQWTITTNTDPFTTNFTFGDPGDAALTWR